MQLNPCAVHHTRAFAGPGWPAFDPVSGGELSSLLLSHPLHVMPSEREGFGHTINEGRAAGALLVVPDHPPMNELVPPGVGVMIQPRAKFTHTDDPVPALGKYANISVSVSPEVGHSAVQDSGSCGK